MLDLHTNKQNNVLLYFEIIFLQFCKTFDLRIYLDSH